MLREGWKMSPNEAQEEFDEVQEDLLKREKENESTASELETGQAKNLLVVVVEIIRASCMPLCPEYFYKHLQ